ncbi:hypothetical protein [Flavobacterium sp.]|uniref:hypothetical protein n=1 Tax=Flavobacterium sp. TaxID=239 RepID=UPI00286EB70E|nr:hypothetical protein [Flavobacterium sp.]
MKIIASIISTLWLLGMVLAFLPLLGWLNWLVIPLAFIGFILSSIAESPKSKSLCTLVIIFGILRLILGGGLF